MSVNPLLLIIQFCFPFIQIYVGLHHTGVSISMGQTSLLTQPSQNIFYRVANEWRRGYKKLETLNVLWPQMFLSNPVLFEQSTFQYTHPESKAYSN